MVCALSMYMGSSRNMDSASSNACNPPIQPYTIIPTHRQTDKLTWPLSAQGNTRNSLLYERNTSIKRGHLYVSYTTIQHTCMTSFCTSKYEEFKLLSLLRKSVKCTEQSLYTLSMEWITRLVINYLSFLDNSGYVCVCIRGYVDGHYRDSLSEELWISPKMFRHHFGYRLLITTKRGY